MVAQRNKKPKKQRRAGLQSTDHVLSGHPCTLSGSDSRRGGDILVCAVPHTY